MLQEQTFEIKLEPINQSGIQLASVPSRNSTVKTFLYKMSLGLLEPVMTDNGSITYRTSDRRYYAKVYTPRVLQWDLMKRKTVHMIKNPVQIAGVCWPVDVILDDKGNFVGIVVPASEGIQLSSSILKGSSGINNYFGNWDRVNLCKVILSILEKMLLIHEQGLLFGCINPATIYINGEEVYFVDADNWQVAGFPVISRNQSFTPPELVNYDNEILLYSLDQDYYQVAVLIFMLLLPGKFPYPQGRNQSVKESIERKSFPFSIGDSMRRAKDSVRPAGVWRIVWDNLTYNLCDAFYNTFHFDGRYANIGKRLNDEEWIRLIREYYSEISSSKKILSNKIFPDTYRRDPKRKFVRCAYCGHEHPDFYFLKRIRIKGNDVNIWDKRYRICIPCANDISDMSFECKCCGRRFFYTNRTKITHEIGVESFDYKNQKWCNDCKSKTARCPRCKRDIPIYHLRNFNDRIRNLNLSVCNNCFHELVEQSKKERAEWKNAIFETRKCRVCGRSFNITNGDVEYFRRKGYGFPTRCPNCRKR